MTRLTPHLRPCHFYISRASLRLRPPPSILFSYFFDPAVNTKSWHLTALLLRIVTDRYLTSPTRYEFSSILYKYARRFLYPPVNKALN